MLSSHVERVTTDASGRADGVLLRGGGRVKARKAVVTNASVWDSIKLVDPSAVPAGVVEKMRAQADATPPCPSFMHLHVGFDAAGAWVPAAAGPTSRVAFGLERKRGWHAWAVTVPRPPRLLSAQRWSDASEALSRKRPCPL